MATDETHQERLLALLKDMGIEPQETVRDGTTWVSLIAHENFPGYGGFECDFAFGPDGTFTRDGSGIWE